MLTGLNSTPNDGWKGSSQNYNSSQRASLAIDFCFGLFGVSPNLARGERNEKGKDDTQGRQQTGGDDLERARSLAHREDVHECIDPRPGR